MNKPLPQPASSTSKAPNAGVNNPQFNSTVDFVELMHNRRKVILELPTVGVLHGENIGNIKDLNPMRFSRKEAITVENEDLNADISNGGSEPSVKPIVTLDVTPTDKSPLFEFIKPKAHKLGRGWKRSPKIQISINVASSPLSH